MIRLAYFVVFNTYEHLNNNCVICFSLVFCFDIWKFTLPGFRNILRKLTWKDACGRRIVYMSFFQSTYHFLHQTALVIVGCFVLLALALSFFLIFQHLRSYNNPAVRALKNFILHIFLTMHACGIYSFKYHSLFTFAPLSLLTCLLFIKE